ncbi:hypothetical protein DQ04_01151150 [Trypanosoma grayi]|uniref:hypothetical protein n=1 Tax=Trypanosoma grayi TaxID=71804 RepID=UPI0004F4B96A|nr:hypothetical protein DQ04_01151150 [Trypanosoma grayi]KEG13208.1 hypothetical protein DQ04_01151150 [Trypanosoma grayi]
MHGVSTLPVNVSVATHVATPFLVGQLDITSGELASLFTLARSSNVHTQPPPLTAKDIKKAMEKSHAFNPAHLNVFLDGYMSGQAPVPEKALSNIRRLSVCSSSEWIHQCQSLALRLLLTELEAREAGASVRSRPDDPSQLVALRQVVSKFQGKAPCISVSNCHFSFVGNIAEDDEAHNERNFYADVSVRNNGVSPSVVKISNVHTVIDGEVVDGDYLACGIVGERTIRRGEATTFHFSLRSPPRRQRNTFEQLIVLSVDVYAKIFVTFTVVSPRQQPFGVGFPRCLSLTVRDSPVGAYASPMMLQLLKHQFIRQQGLASKGVGQLLVGKSVNHSIRNREVMREATRVKEILEEEMDFSEVLGTYRAALPKDTCGSVELPTSSAQPAGYLPGGLLPTAVAAVSSMSCFPNAATRLPGVLTNAQPDVLMGLILIWLAEFEVPVFDASLLIYDPMTYLEAMPPYHRGVILWTVDLCGGLLLHKEDNGVSLRHLALTFAAVLMRKRPPVSGGNVDSVFKDTPSKITTKEAPQDGGTSVGADVALQQSAVTAFVYWITVFGACYNKCRPA